MTKPIHTIVVPVDLAQSSELILDWGKELAKSHHAKIVLLHVLPVVHEFATPVFVDHHAYQDYYSRARELARESLSSMAAAVISEGLHATVLVRIGNAADEILATAHETGADLIVIGTHGRTGIARMVLGSTAEKVVRLAECPVFVAKAPRSRTPDGEQAPTKDQEIGWTS